MFCLALTTADAERRLVMFCLLRCVSVPLLFKHAQQLLLQSSAVSVHEEAAGSQSYDAMINEPCFVQKNANDPTRLTVALKNQGSSEVRGRAVPVWLRCLCRRAAMGRGAPLQRRPCHAVSLQSLNAGSPMPLLLNVHVQLEAMPRHGQCRASISIHACCDVHLCAKRCQG